MTRTQTLLAFMATAVIAVGAGAGMAWLRTAAAPAATAAVALFSSTFDDADGRPQPIAQWQGRPLVVNFWATWCPPCRAEMPELLQAAREYPDLVLLAVNVSETPEAVSRFAEQFRMDAAVVLDPQGAISDRYNVRGLPTSVFLDADGLIQEVRPGAINRKVIDEILQR